MPKLSFIVPVYNVAAYLRACLDSLLGQTEKDIEIICVDDGSTDESGTILKQAAQDDVRVKLICQNNSGVSAARNRGIEESCGEYLVFVDADDYVDTCLAQQVLLVAKEQRADIVVFGGTCEPPVKWVGEVLDTQPGLLKEAGAGFDALFTRRGCIPFLWNKAYKSSLIAEFGVRFDETLKLGEDTAFQFRAFPPANTIAFISNRLYHYRFQRKGSAVDTLFADVLQQQKDHIAVLDSICRDWHERGYLDKKASPLLECLAFLFRDALALDAHEREAFTQDFNVVFYRWFSAEQIGRLQRGARALYACCSLWGKQDKGLKEQMSLAFYRLYLAASKLKNA